jgi:stage III sporulation protein AB
MIKAWGAFLVIGAATVWGYLAAVRFCERCRLLRIWIWIFEIMKTEIFYQSRLLPEILQKVAGQAGKAEIGRLFRELAADVTYGSAVVWTEAWRKLLAAPRWQNLKEPEREVLEQLGLFLGSTERQDQLEKLNGAKHSLEQILLTATADERKQVGLYRYLGFAIGVMLVLVIY